MTHTPVSSSNIESVAYDPGSQKLQVQMRHGKLYEFSGVHPQVHQDLMTAPSIGSHFHQHIKGRFEQTP